MLIHAHLMSGLLQRNHIVSTIFAWKNPIFFSYPQDIGVATFRFHDTEITAGAGATSVGAAASTTAAAAAVASATLPLRGGSNSFCKAKRCRWQWCRNTFAQCCRRE